MMGVIFVCVCVCVCAAGLHTSALSCVCVWTTYLDFNRYDHRDELFIQFPQHNQLLQSQTAQSAETERGRMNV